LTVQQDLTKNLRCIFRDCYRKRSKWIAAIHRNNWTSQRKVDLQLSFCVSMLNLGVKPYPYIFYCYIYTVY